MVGIARLRQCAQKVAVLDQAPPVAPVDRVQTLWARQSTRVETAAPEDTVLVVRPCPAAVAEGPQDKPLWEVTA